MSRTLKRVPASFDWPQGHVWHGYVNPYYVLAAVCPDCENGCDRVRGRPDANAALFAAQWYGEAPFDPVTYGAQPLSPDSPALWAFAKQNVTRSPDFYMAVHSGDRERTLPRVAELRERLEGLVQTAIAREADRLYQLWRGQWLHQLAQADVDALVAERRLPEFTHRPRTAEQAARLSEQAKAGGSSYWLEEPNGYHPSAAEVNEWSIGGMGHDAINQGVCVEARCAREGVPYLCAKCGGSATIWPSPEIEQKCEDWRRTDPPSGDGYQLWSTTSEGTPISPVFGTLEELCAWAEVNATTFGRSTATAAEWKTMLAEDDVHGSDEEGNVYL